jgi:iron-sulfur cluster insertion protein
MLQISNTEQTTAQSPPLHVTDTACLKVYELITEEDNAELKLRVYVTGGGCSGFQYGFGFDEKINEEEDFIIVKKLGTDAALTDIKRITLAHERKTPEINVLIDALSFPYLKGAEIDYVKDLNGEQFVIRSNPNVKTTCGCGSSFSAD